MCIENSKVIAYENIFRSINEENLYYGMEFFKVSNTKEVKGWIFSERKTFTY